MTMHTDAKYRRFVNPSTIESIGANTHKAAASIARKDTVVRNTAKLAGDVA
jgi:hypothetical protein